jgi:hypothetical protein
MIERLSPFAVISTRALVVSDFFSHIRRKRGRGNVGNLFCALYGKHIAYISRSLFSGAQSMVDRGL